MTYPSDPVFEATNPQDDREPCMLDAGDVRITDIEPRPCSDCGDEVVATKVVWLFMRNNGQNMAIGEFCAPCAEEFASRLRVSLPEEKPE